MSKHFVSEEDTQEIAIRFSYHPPTSGQKLRYGRLRAMAHDFAMVIMGDCPDSRERSTALTKLEEAVMHANASIARREEDDG